MNHSILKRKNRIIVHADPDFILGSEEEALDIAAFCWENDTSSLLITSYNLPEEFYNLRTGLAGNVLQKFSTYRIKLAAVIPGDKISGKFIEMAIESNRGNNFRIFNNKSEAEEWLLAD